MAFLKTVNYLGQLSFIIESRLRFSHAEGIHMSPSCLVSLVSNKGEIYASGFGHFSWIQPQQGTNALKKQTFVCSLNYFFGKNHMLNFPTTF